MTDTAPDEHDDEDGRVEPLPEDADIEPPLAGDLDEDADEVLTPFPGFDHNPIFGVGGVGAFEGTRPPDVLSGKVPGVVLLEVQGPRRSARALFFGLLGAACAVLGLFLALSRHDVDPSALPWPGLHSPALTILVLVAGGVLLGAGLLIRVVLGTADVTFTTDGVARRGARSDAWVPWSEVTGYRIERDGFVSLHGRGGRTLVVPTSERRQQGEVVALLDGREVPRV